MGMDLNDLRKLIDDSGMTQRDFAEKVGINHQHLNGVLRGKRKLTPEIVSRVKAAMREEVNVLLPTDIEPMLRAWAEKTHKSIDDLVESILKEYLDKIKDGD